MANAPRSDSDQGGSVESDTLDMRLVFVRHGQTLANAEGRIQGQAPAPAYGLSSEGRAHTQKLRDRFLREGFKPTKIYASPLRRTLETAEILAEPWSIQVSPWDDLMEHDYGEGTGLTWEDVRKRFPNEYADFEQSKPIAGFDGAEPLEDRRERGRRVVDQILRDHPNDSTFLLVSHGGILQNIVSAILGSPRVWKLSVANTALFDFTVDGERWNEDGEARLDTSLWRINRFNDASHLA